MEHNTISGGHDFCSLQLVLKESFLLESDLLVWFSGCGSLLRLHEHGLALNIGHNFFFPFKLILYFMSIALEKHFLCQDGLASSVTCSFRTALRHALRNDFFLVINP